MKIILFVEIIELYLWRYVPELKAAVRDFSHRRLTFNTNLLYLFI